MSAPNPLPASLGDFTATRRMLPITALAIAIGGAAAVVAFALLRLIRTPVTTHPDETLRGVVQRMAETGRTRLPVVDRDTPGRLLGMVSLANTLKARQRHVEEERRRERILDVRGLIPRVLRSRYALPSSPTQGT